MKEIMLYYEYLRDVEKPWCIKFYDKNGNKTNAPYYHVPRSVENLRVEVDKENYYCKFLDREDSGNTIRGIMTLEEMEKSDKMYIKDKYPFSFLKWLGAIFLLAIASILLL